MKALYFNSHGSINNITYDSLEEPTEEEGCAILEVLYSSLNHLDLWVLKGWKGLNLKMPHIGGADIVGKVAHVSSNNQKIQLGDIVCVNPGYLPPNASDEYITSGKEQLSPQYGIFGETAHGGFSEFVKVPLRNVYKIDNVPKEQLPRICASLLVGLTSYRMLVTRAEIVKGHTVLVVGSTGGVNSYSIKLAKYLGATVIALTSSESKEKFSKNIGADHVINYKKHPTWSTTVKEISNGGVDIVIDNVGKESISQSIRSLKPEGKIITVGNTSGHELSIDNRLIFSKQISIIGSTMGSKKDFESVLKLIFQHDITAEISSIIPLSNGKSGYAILESGAQMGKIVFNNRT